MWGDKQISCQTMADRIGTGGTAKAVQINQKKISQQFNFDSNFFASLNFAMCMYSEETFCFQEIL